MSFFLKQEDEEEIIKCVKGLCNYREFNRKYLNGMNEAIKESVRIDMGARLSILINYFRGGKWWYDCLKFTLSQEQCEIIIPKDKNFFI